MSEHERTSNHHAPDENTDAATALDTALDTAWTDYLSQTTSLRAIDHKTTEHVLSAVRRERKRRGQLRTQLIRWSTSLALAATIVGLMVLQQPRSTQVNAYDLYEEANQGW